MISKCLQILGFHSRISKVFPRSQKKNFITVGQNNFGNEIPFILQIDNLEKVRFVSDFTLKLDRLSYTIWNFSILCFFLIFLPKKTKIQMLQINLPNSFFVMVNKRDFMKITYLHESTNIEEISRVNTMGEWSKCTKYDFIPMLKSLPNNSILWKSN